LIATSSAGWQGVLGPAAIAGACVGRPWVQSHILGLAFGPGLILTATGTLVGVGVSVVVTRLMSSLLFGVSSSDPMTFAVVPVLLGIATMAACFIPARRATRVSPFRCSGRAQWRSGRADHRTTL